MNTGWNNGWLRKATACALGALTLLPLLAVTPAHADRWDGWDRDRNGSFAQRYNRDYWADRRAHRHFRRHLRRRLRNGRVIYVPTVRPYGTYGGPTYVPYIR